MSSPFNPKSKGVSIIIPTWNGRHLLEKFLPSVIAAANAYAHHTGAEVEIIVVDDGSTDDTADWLQATYWQILTVRKEKNEGFSPACNAGFARARHPVILLLNNDVQVEADILFYLVDHFSDPVVVAVCCKALEAQTHSVATAGKMGEFKRGFWRVYKNYDVSGQWSVVGGQPSETTTQKPETGSQGPKIGDQRVVMNDRRPAISDPKDESPTTNHEPRNQYYSILASGGFSAYATEKLRQLGGFNDLLAPFYWEDVEFSLRAWKRGWKILYEPRAIVYHATSSTIGAHFERRQVDMIAQRNRLITHWINLHDRLWLMEHVGIVMLLLLSSLLTLNFSFWRAFLRALQCLPAVLKQRARERSARKLSDRQLARLVGPGEHRPDIVVL
jgi:GT2 family glycosyltransferase